MSYYLKVDPESTLKGTITSPELGRSALPPHNGLVDKVYYEVPIEKVPIFESCMKFNCIDYAYVSDTNESVTYTLPYSEFTFINADVIEFDFSSTFGRHIRELEEAIELSYPSVAIGISTHPKYKEELEKFLILNKVFFEFLQEDENTASYIISRERMEK